MHVNMSAIFRIERNKCFQGQIIAKSLFYLSQSHNFFKWFSRSDLNLEKSERRKHEIHVYSHFHSQRNWAHPELWHQSCILPQTNSINTKQTWPIMKHENQISYFLQPYTTYLLRGSVFHLFLSLKPLLASCNMSSRCSCVYAKLSFSTVSSQNRAQICWQNTQKSRAETWFLTCTYSVFLTCKDKRVYTTYKHIFLSVKTCLTLL